MVLAKGFSVHFFGQNDSFILIIMGDLGHCEGCHVTVATRDQNNLHGLFARILASIAFASNSTVESGGTVKLA